MDDDVLCGRVRRLDPEFAEEGELLVEAGGRAPIARPRADRAMALAAAEEAEIARAEKRDHFVPDVRRVDREVRSI